MRARRVHPVKLLQSSHRQAPQQTRIADNVGLSLISCQSYQMEPAWCRCRQLLRNQGPVGIIEARSSMDAIQWHHRAIVDVMLTFLLYR